MKVLTRCSGKSNLYQRDKVPKWGEGQKKKRGALLLSHLRKRGGGLLSLFKRSASYNHPVDATLLLAI